MRIKKHSHAILNFGNVCGINALYKFSGSTSLYIGILCPTILINVSYFQLNALKFGIGCIGFRGLRAYMCDRKRKCVGRFQLNAGHNLSGVAVQFATQFGANATQ